MNVRIYDGSTSSLLLKGVYDDFVSAILTQQFQGSGSFELHFSDAVSDIVLNDFVVFDDDLTQVGIVERLYNNIDGGDPSSSSDYCVSGRCLVSILDRRITVPDPDGDGWRRWNNKYPSVILRELVYYNADSRGMVTTDRAITDLVCDNQIDVGTRMDFDTRYEGLLDECIKVCETSGLGMRIKLTDSNLMVFEVLQGTDRTQSDVNKYVFSTSFDNILSLTYEEDISELKNYAYVLGQGEGINRRVVVVDNDSVTGRIRREIAVDARDIAEENSDVQGYDPVVALMDRGNEKLLEHLKVDNFEIDVLCNDFKTKWFLGDSCICLDKNSGKQLSAQVLEVTQTWEDGGYIVSAVVGNVGKTINEKIDAVSLPVVTDARSKGFFTGIVVVTVNGDWTGLIDLSAIRSKFGISTLTDSDVTVTAMNGNVSVLDFSVKGVWFDSSVGNGGRFKVKFDRTISNIGVQVNFTVYLKDVEVVN